MAVFVPSCGTASATLPSMPKHEITGHDVNHTADDIGEEINGIGFISTPAMVTKLRMAPSRSQNGALANQKKQDSAATTSANPHTATRPFLWKKEALSGAAASHVRLVGTRMTP
jgi:hypothetical protein